MIHLRNNPDLDEFPMNNITIRTQIAECEVAYYKIRHTNLFILYAAREHIENTKEVNQFPKG